MICPEPAAHAVPPIDASLCNLLCLDFADRGDVDVMECSGTFGSQSGQGLLLTLENTLKALQPLIRSAEGCSSRFLIPVLEVKWRTKFCPYH
jgi:hypothetical protein